MKYFLAVVCVFLFTVVIIGQNDPEFEPVIRECHIIILSILLEAFPFILAGSLISGIIEVFVSRERMLSLIPKNRLAAACFASLLGCVLPICECGIIPVVRRLTKKGVPVFFAVTYMLAAPIINPVVIASTIVAYKGAPDIWAVAGARIGGGFVISVTIGVICSFLFKKSSVIKQNDASRGSGKDMCILHREAQPGSAYRKLLMVFNHAASDFFDIGPFLILGAFIAGLFRSVSIPVNGEDVRLMNIVMGHGSVQIYSMMALAVVLSLCSEADAFFSRAFTAGFAARLSFLVTGPMLDIKLFIMYFKVFRKRMIVFLVVSVTVLNIAAWQLLYCIMKVVSDG